MSALWRRGSLLSGLSSSAISLRIPSLLPFQSTRTQHAACSSIHHLSSGFSSPFSSKATATASAPLPQPLTEHFHKPSCPSQSSKSGCPSCTGNPPSSPGTATSSSQQQLHAAPLPSTKGATVTFSNPSYSAGSAQAMPQAAPATPVETFYKRPLPSFLIPFSSPEGKQIFQEALAAGGTQWISSFNEARTLQPVMNHLS